MFDTLFYAFCLQFGSILLNLGSILLVFWLYFEPILDPSASPEGSRGQGHEMCTKCIDFGVPWASHLEGIFAQKAIKKSIKILLNFLIDFSLILRANMAPKTLPKTFKNQSTNLSKNPYVFSWIGHWFRKKFLKYFQAFSNEFHYVR